MRKVQFRGLHSDKKAEFIYINDGFFRKRNDVNGLFMQTLIICLLLITTGCSKTKIEYWSNGNKKSELKFYNGKMNGLCTWWYEDGTKQMECNYQDNKLEGKSIRWNFDGTKQREDNYSNNLLNGISVIFYDNEAKKSEQNFKNDSLEGLSREWFKNGQIKVTGSYKKGYFDGKWIYTDIYGLKAGEGEFVSGTGNQTGYYPDGKISRKIHYVKNKKNGLETWLNTSGDTLKKNIYENDRIVFQKVYKK